MFGIFLKIFVFFFILHTFGRFLQLAAQATTTATAEKTSLENNHLGKDDYFVIITSSSHLLSLTEHAANRLVAAPLK